MCDPQLLIKKQFSPLYKNIRLTFAVLSDLHHIMCMDLVPSGSDTQYFTTTPPSLTALPAASYDTGDMLKYYYITTISKKSKVRNYQEK